MIPRGGDAMAGDNFTLDRFVLESADRMPGGFLIYKADEDETLLYANAKLLEMFSCDSFDELKHLYGTGFKDLIYIEDVKNAETSIYNQIVSGFDRFDNLNYRISDKNGEIKYIEHYGRLTDDDEHGRLFYVFMIDTGTKHITYELNRLTGLPGMHRFYEFSKKLLALNAVNPNAQDFSFVYFNIENFSTVNLKHGVKGGDEFLVNVSQILRHVFPDDFLAHMANDRFAVLTESSGLKERITLAHNLVRGQSFDLKVELKAGIYNVEDKEVVPSQASGYAKFACDSIKDKPSVYYAVYDEKMKFEFEQRQFVVDNIENAVRSGHIEAFYQPVIRSLSGKVCSMEALARWRDPEKGLLSPAVFITALEDSMLIHKLDCCMIEIICREYREHADKREKIVPVSFNLSRCDFILCDIFRFVEDTVKKYDVPKNMLRIEITESVIISEYDYIRSVIDKFRNAGYEIWMDDFGSGYSSLNVLKDLNFDRLKIDMLFLSNFNDKSKDILTSIVRMSKTINVRTLAEGVETKEQYEFLKNIGCETLQGFWFGRPMPYDECMEHLANSGLTLEDSDEERFYDPAGEQDFMTDVSMALVYDDGNKFSYLFANSRHIRLLNLLGLRDTRFVEKMVNSNMTPFAPALRGFIRKPAESRKREDLYYTANGKYIRIVIRTLSERNGHYIHKVRASDMTRNEDDERQENLDNMLRVLYQMYKAVYMLDIEKQTFSKLFTNSYFGQKGADYSNVMDIRSSFSKGFVHPDDAERFVAFANKEYFREGIANSKHGFISECFRSLDADGGYEWALHTVLSLPNADSERYLYCISDIITDDTELSLRHKQMLNELYNQ